MLWKSLEDWRLGRIIWHEVPSLLQYYHNHINIAYSRKCLQSPNVTKNNKYYTLLYYSKVLLVSSCKINLNIPQLSMIFQAIFQSWKKVNNNHEDCCIVTIIVIVRLEDSYSKHWSRRRILPYHFVVGMLLKEQRFELRYSESGVIAQVPFKYWPGVVGE